MSRRFGNSILHSAIAVFGSFLTLLLAALPICSCSKNDSGSNPPQEYKLTVKTTGPDHFDPQYVWPLGSLIDVKLTANYNWDIDINYSGTQSNWINVLWAGGDKKSGSYSFSIVIAANTNDSDRSAVISFVCGDKVENLSILQKSSNIVMVSPYEYSSVSAPSSDIEFTVMSKLPYSYTINDNCIVESNLENWKDGKVYFKAESKPSGKNTASITFSNAISDQTVTLDFY